MQNGFSSFAAATAVLLALPYGALGLYSKSSPVLQVNAKNYDNLIARSNHTSILEFYAPWCGHCKNLKEPYEKAAKSLAGLAKVAAIDCDDESNKAFCGSMGVQGFPTLKIIKPGSKAGRPIVEDYQGPRTAKGIVDAVIDKIPNHVKRLGEKDFDSWLNADNQTAKAILFSTKGTTTPLIKSLAVDFLGSIKFVQVRDKETAVVDRFPILAIPALVLLPGGDEPAMIYDGKLKKEPITAFLAQVAPPNPDPAPKAPKPSPSKKKESKEGKKDSKQESKKEQKKSQEAKAAFEEASSSHSSEDASKTATQTATVRTSIKIGSVPSDAPDDEPIPIDIVLEDPSGPSESPNPIASPSDAPAPKQVLEPRTTIPTIESDKELKKICLGPKTSTCILVLLPEVAKAESMLPMEVTTTLSGLADISDKLSKRQGAPFPFYAVPSLNVEAFNLRKDLRLKDINEMDIVAINVRRGWWRPYQGKDFGAKSLEDWVDSVRLGEGRKENLPASVLKKIETWNHEEL